jgi:hypothetical protein
MAPCHDEGMGDTDREAGVCEKCGASFTPNSTGRPRRHCEACEKTRGHAVDAEGDRARSDAALKRRRKAESEADDPGVRLLQRAAHLAVSLAVGGDSRTAARLCGFNPADDELVELERIAREKFPELISGSVDGIRQIGRDLIAHVLLEATFQRHSIAPSQLGVTAQRVASLIEELDAGSGTNWTQINVNFAAPLTPEQVAEKRREQETHLSLVK